MSWHGEVLHLEILAEFRRLDGMGSHWSRIEDAVYLEKLIDRDWMRGKRAVLRTIAVGQGKCSVCGGLYKRMAICSQRCAAKRTHTQTDRVFAMDGKVQTVAEWAREYGVNHLTVNYRLSRGMDIREALTHPKKRRPCEACGKAYRTKRLDQRFCGGKCSKRYHTRHRVRPSRAKAKAA
jgi:hypothetical protein